MTLCIRALQDLGRVAVACTLLLAFSIDGWGQAQRVKAPPGATIGDKDERGRGRSNPPAACRDTTPHKTRFIRVEAGVWLEVVDWGGEHKPRTMVLLTGLGDNAHVYDQFAQQFIDDFHVIGITRRGFYPSSQPSTGYDVETRARDDIAVLDALRISRATFVGHSLAGSELAKLGEVYGNRVDKLVFLDAADLADRFSPSRTEPPGQSALFTDATLESLQAFQAASARYSALRKPDAAVCIEIVFGPKGEIVASRTPDWVDDKLLQGVSGAENPRVNWAHIAAPRLGIFAQYTLEARQAWYWYLSASEQAEFDRAWPSIAAWHKDTIDRFANGNPTPTVRLQGVPHYVYINNETEVVREMRKFLGLPVGGN
jgi:pimeloyl-ACP methyl ester carboxylesterase